MTGTNPVQDHIDALEADEEAARGLLDRALHLARRQSDRHPAPPLPESAGRTLRLAVGFHRRAETAAAELDDCINYLKRNGR
ncbi:hypothetical protein AB0M29_34945 [Streptomyces sp. NPDC051976]|uniref:hypothetical protein n=1 Tax=Streptomyces sp. NPDC051976 TaxID=3154947 RepID=UPI00342ECDDB